MSVVFARLFARLFAPASARLNPLLEARLPASAATLRMYARLMLTTAVLVAMAVVETAGRRWWT